MGTGTIFMVQGEELLEMTETKYESEDFLQELLATHPKLLPGDQIDTANPRRWLFIEREVGVPGEEGGSNRWSLDHLFLDQDSVPTLIEVKRSSDTRIRREVVGQMLDYAANAVMYWPVEKIRVSFDARCEAEGVDPDEVLRDFLDDHDPDDYWKQVKINLQAGRVRLLFVADVIPDELRRIVEFLNEQMDPADVLAVEVRQFTDGEVRTLVPQVYGATAAAQVRKGGGGRPKRVWDLEEFRRELGRSCGLHIVDVVEKILDSTREMLPVLEFGEGAITGYAYPLIERDGKKFCPFAILTSGIIQLQFGQIRKRPPFDDESKRIQFLEKLNAVPGVSLPGDACDRYPSIRLDSLEDDKILGAFLEVVDWYVEEINRCGGDLGRNG